MFRLKKKCNYDKVCYHINDDIIVDHELDSGQ